ncbi:hypothetical protein BJX63DRAFT_217778 [Aspergillus granulosus]|uniref:Mid2 domain-containing protein n=1 Tax=Aspergillus granulosus TaxID=176169 RepID=A0ABR4I197_9EURO
MLSITSIWIAVLITIQSTLGIAIAVANPDPGAGPIARSSTKLSSDENYFTSPVPDSHSSPEADLVYEVGDVVEISWATTLDVFNVTLWQRQLVQEGNDATGVISGGNIFSTISPTSTLTNISWIVQPYEIDLEKSATFFLSIDAYTNTAHSLDYDSWPSTGFVSGLFNISSRSSLSSPTPSQPDSGSDAPTSSTDTTITDTHPESTNSPETSLTSTGKIALGLGVGIGTPLITLLAILAYFQVRSARRKYATAPHHPSHQHPPPIPPPPPEMSLSMAGMAHHHPQHHLYPPLSIDPSANLGLGINPHVQPLYQNQIPSELPQKLAKPIVLPPWEVDAAPPDPNPTPDSGSRSPGSNGTGAGNTNGVKRVNTTITVIPRARPKPKPSSGLGLERERGRRGPGLGEGTGPGKKRSMWSTRRVGQNRDSTITIGIPELPGENYI